MIGYQEAEQKLASVEQGHLLDHWSSLGGSERAQLLDQIDRLDLDLFHRQQQLLLRTSAYLVRPQKVLAVPSGCGGHLDRSAPHPGASTLGSSRSSRPGSPRRGSHLPGLSEDVPYLPNFAPYDDLAFAADQPPPNSADDLMAGGKFGVVVVAGGVGSRLRFDGPKGCFPVTPIERKSLFQLIADRVQRVGERFGRKIPLAIMTSPQNHLETVRYFEHHDLCGLEKGQLSFFVQSTAPLLTDQGGLFLETPSRIAVGSDGNGGALHGLYRSGIWERWKEQGVEFFHFVPVDNPLADPCDPLLLAFHVQQEGEVTLKCAERQDPDEKLGIVVLVQGAPYVIEYSEMPKIERERRDGRGGLLYRTANLSLFCFSMSFVPRIFEMETPLHLAHKAARFLDREGVTRLSDGPIAWKFERFIFDLLPLAHRVSTLLYPRDRVYAALKCEADLPALQKALSKLPSHLY